MDRRANRGLPCSTLVPVQRNPPGRKMNQILIPLLYGLAGICAFAAMHHCIISWRLPVKRTHLLYAAMCLAITLYVIAKAGAYQTETAQALVSMRRREIVFAAMFFMLFPWFVGSYTGVRPRWVLIGLSAWAFLFWGAANLVLPYGISFVELPELQHLVLPWGETVTDLRVHHRSLWHTAAWLGNVLEFAYAIHACIKQYRNGARRRALTLALGLTLLITCIMFNQVVNLGLVEFTHIAEFGFAGLVMVMSIGLTGELNEHGRRLQAIVDNVPAAIYMKDLNGRYLLVNRHFTMQLPAGSTSVIGKTAYDLIPETQATAGRANDLRVIGTRGALEFEEIIDLDGQTRVYSSLKFPLLDADGLPYAICGVSTDVTHLRKAEGEANSLRQQVWHTDRVARVGALSVSIAHELNQPLTAILSNAQAALRFLDGGNADFGEIREILEDIVRDDKRAATVISSLRAMVKRQETARARIDLSEAVRELLNILHGEILIRQIETSTDFSADCMVLADKGQIQQVMLNLITNAMEAMSEQPARERRLHISTRIEGDAALTTVRDTGIGIAAEELASVFTAFRSTKPQGMGMGLSVCHSILDSHGGSIWMEPNADRGVSVFVKLPLDKPGKPA